MVLEDQNGETEMAIIIDILPSNFTVKSTKEYQSTRVFWVKIAFSEDRLKSMREVVKV